LQFSLNPFNHAPFLILLEKYDYGVTIECFRSARRAALRLPGASRVSFTDERKPIQIEERSDRAHR
jgi:hypothetical protein